MPDHDHAPLALLLRELVAAHQHLLNGVADQRRAIAGADPIGVAEATRRQQQAAATIAELEQRRRELVVEMMRAYPGLPAGPAGQPTLATLASVLPEPDRALACEQAATLKDLLVRVRREAGRVRTATALLMAHMDGLMIQLGRRLSHDGTYAHPGKRAHASPVVSAVDLTS